MEKGIEPINRRSLLQRGLVLLAGVLGCEVVEPGGCVQAAPVPGGGGQTLRLYARRWQSHAHGQEPGELPAWNGRTNRHGELFASPEGQPIGAFYTACFCPEGSFGGGPSTRASIELQTFKLGDDTLFGMGSFSPGLDGSQLHAVVGGTGRFAGARGSYRINCLPGAGNRNSVEIFVTILT